MPLRRTTSSAHRSSRRCRDLAVSPESTRPRSFIALIELAMSSAELSGFSFWIIALPGAGSLR